MEFNDIIIDSRRRDKYTFPSPNSYSLPLSLANKYNEKIVAVQVVQLDVPFTRPLIHPYNNFLLIEDFLQNVVKIKFPCGNYNNRCPSTMAQIMTNAMDPIMKNQKIHVMYDQMSGKFTFTSNKDFAIHWDEGCQKLAKMMGFMDMKMDAEMDFSCGNFVINAPFCYNFNNEIIKLGISQLSTESNPFGIVGIVTSTSQCILPYVSGHHNLSYDNLQEISISFYDDDDILYDFENNEHVIVLRFFEAKK
jgi:hypothetical protein